jgi:phosphomannomutase/phosphoglucomutase
MIEIVSKMGKKLSNVLKDLPARFFERIEIDCSDETKFKVLDRIKEEATRKYDNVDKTDGAKIVFQDSWALIRASNTSPEIRLSLEAKEEKRMSELKTEMMSLIRQVVPDVERRIR